MKPKILVIQAPLVAAALCLVSAFFGFLPLLKGAWQEGVAYFVGFTIVVSGCLWLHNSSPKIGTLLMLPVFLGGIYVLKLGIGYIFQDKVVETTEKSVLKDVVTSERNVSFKFENTTGKAGRIYATLQPCNKLEPVYANRVFVGTVNARGWNQLHFSFRDIYWPYLQSAEKDVCCLDIRLNLVLSDKTEMVVGYIDYQVGSSTLVRN